jgi:precorrin-2 dehydrogenase/sirohydrochlorin ferrochelatase
VGYYATFLDLGGVSCLVVGGGPTADAKVGGLLEAGARVTVVAPAPGREILARAADGSIALVRRAFKPIDLDGMFLVIDASLDEPTGVEVSRTAREWGVLVNVLDKPLLCDFIAPAMLRRGPLQVAISTGGRSPFMAAQVRRTLEAQLGTEWGELVELVGRLRDELRARDVPLDVQEKVYARIPSSGALEHLRVGDAAGAAELVYGCALAERVVLP